VARLRGWSPVGIAIRSLLAALALVSVTGLVYLRSWPPMATVLSSSMEPHIRVGDVVLLKSLSGHAPHVGDVVLVHVPMEAQRSYKYPDRVIHRVISIRGGLVQTKGDNLHQPDPFAVPVGDVHERVRAVVPSAGRVVGFVLSPFGLVWLGAGAVLLVGMPMVDLQRERVRVERVSLTALDGVQSNLRSLEARLGSVNTATLEQAISAAVQRLASAEPQRQELPDPPAEPLTQRNSRSRPVTPRVAPTRSTKARTAEPGDQVADAGGSCRCSLLEFPCRHVITS